MRTFECLALEVKLLIRTPGQLTGLVHLKGTDIFAYTFICKIPALSRRRKRCPCVCMYMHTFSAVTRSLDRTDVCGDMHVCVCAHEHSQPPHQSCPNKCCDAPPHVECDGVTELMRGKSAQKQGGKETERARKKGQDASGRGKGEEKGGGEGTRGARPWLVCAGGLWWSLWTSRRHTSSSC